MHAQSSVANCSWLLLVMHRTSASVMLMCHCLKQHTPSRIHCYTRGCLCRLHTVHDEEKPFEIEMAWICDDSKKQFVKVPADLVAEADKAAKDALNSDM